MSRMCGACEPSLYWISAVFAARLWEKNYRTASRLSFFKKVNEFWLIEGFPQEPQWSYFIYKQLEEETPLFSLPQTDFFKPSLWAPCLPPNSVTLKKHTFFGKTSLFVQHATNNQKRQKVWIMQNCFLGLILVCLCRDSLFEHIKQGSNINLETHS